MTSPSRQTPPDRPLHFVLLAAVVGVVVWSWIGAADRPTWWLESFPVFIALPVLLGTARRFSLTRLACVLIALHMMILLVGAHYTYEKVPPFNWLRDHFHLSRNHYDRLGHLAQGFVPAVVAREVLVRKRVVNGAGWLAFLVWCFCMAVSACYELFEGAATLVMGSGADKFQGSQGDPLDTQWDMFCALVGATVALLFLRKFHDREIQRIDPGI